MFSSTKPCLYKETNDSYSSTVIGILLVALTITVGLSVLGVWVNAENGSQNDDFEFPFIPKKNQITEIASEITISQGQSSEVSDGAYLGLCDGPVPECGSVGRFDTVPGTLEIDWSNTYLPSESDPLPLCIDNAWLSDYYMTVTSIGGYSPKCGAVLLNQLKGGTCFEGVIIANFEERPVAGTCPCEVDYYITFTTKDDLPICLDSNHLPQGFDQTKTLDKWVDVCYVSTWEGCHLGTQEFMVILAHKAMSQKP